MYVPRKVRARREINVSHNRDFWLQEEAVVLMTCRRNFILVISDV